MYKFGENRPYILQIILTLLAFGLAIGSYYAGEFFLDFPPILTFLVGMIAVGLLLMLVFIKAFLGEKPKRSILVAIPALLFVAWNIYYNLDAGNAIGEVDWLIRAAITSIAIAIFYEVLCRGIFIWNLERNDYNVFGCMVFSSLFYILTYIPNLIGKDLLSAGLKAAYAFVVGLILATIYLRNRRIFQIILLRFLIELSARVFIGNKTSFTQLQLIIFVALLVVELLYANIVTLANRKKNMEY